MIAFEQQYYIAMVQDGKGVSKDLGKFTERNDALEVGLEYCKNNKGYSPKIAEASVSVLVFESPDEYREHLDYNLFKQVTEKLTPEELRVLERHYSVGLHSYEDLMKMAEAVDEAEPESDNYWIKPVADFLRRLATLAPKEVR